MTTTEPLPIVAILDWFEDAPFERKLLEGVAEVRCYHLGAQDELPDSISEASAVIRFRMPAIGARELAKMKPRCKVFIAASVGYDRIDLRAAGELGIPVVHLPDYCTEEVADTALCLLIMLARKTLGFVRLVENNRWPFVGELDNLPAMRLRGKTLGVIGLGRIGSALAVRAKAVGLEVVFYDPFLKDGMEKSFGIGRVASLEALLAAADIVSVNCNLTADNRHMIGAVALSHCKRGALLVNTARGPLVEESAMVAALRSGQLGGAAIDVVEQEPYLDGHLSAVPNLIITPHAAHYSLESVVERRTKAVQAAKDAIQGHPLRNVVNGEFLALKLH